MARVHAHDSDKFGREPLIRDALRGREREMHAVGTIGAVNKPIGAVDVRAERHNMQPGMTRRELRDDLVETKQASPQLRVLRRLRRVLDRTRCPRDTYMRGARNLHGSVELTPDECVDRGLAQMREIAAAAELHVGRFHE